jgi:phage portal protein BeeE
MGRGEEQQGHGLPQLAIEAKGMGWSARDLALVEARNESAIGIARIANLDPVWVGASVSGTSLTYSNRVDLFRQLLDISLRPVMDMLTHRLSMPDVTPRGHAVRFDTSGFLRGNAADLGNLVAQLVPLGILTPDEARMVIDLNTLGLTPTSLVEMGSS